MELQNQIRKYRTAMNLSQEELAEKVYVSRQTISNWETGKNYPDIHSLLLLSSLFEISLDQLIKGDIEIMREEINKDEVKKFNHYSNIFAALFWGSIILFVPLVVFLKVYGLVIWIGFYVITLLLGIKIEKFKKNYDIHTFKEIVAFSEGKRLDEISKQREIGKRPYQTFMKLLFGACLGAIVAAIALWLAN